MIPDYKYSCYKTENCGQAAQMQLSKKQKICYKFIAAFLEATSNFQHFEKKDQVDHSTISDNIDSKRSSHLSVLQPMF